MSCFIMDKERIALLAHITSDFTWWGITEFGFTVPECLFRELEPMLPDKERVYEALYRMNVRAYQQSTVGKEENVSMTPPDVAHDFNDNSVCAKVRGLPPHLPSQWHFSFLKLLDCWLYQCDEGDVPNDPLYKGMKAFRESLTAFVVKKDQRYGDTWEYDASVFASGAENAEAAPATESAPGTITKEQIKDGISRKTVRFIVDPNMDKGTVCEIGEHWFYFGGETAATEPPAEFLKHADMDEVIEGIVSALEGIRDDLGCEDEYNYYAAILNEASAQNDKKEDTGIKATPQKYYTVVLLHEPKRADDKNFAFVFKGRMSGEVFIDRCSAPYIIRGAKFKEGKDGKSIQVISPDSPYSTPDLMWRIEEVEIETPTGPANPDLFDHPQFYVGVGGGVSDLNIKLFDDKTVAERWLLTAAGLPCPSLGEDQFVRRMTVNDIEWRLFPTFLQP